MKYQVSHSGIFPCRAVHAAAFFATFATALVFSAPVMAFDTYQAVIADPAPQTAREFTTRFPDADKTAFGQSPSPSVSDSCLPLLKSLQQYSPYTDTDRNQRSAGKAAALGVVFGLRFALGPTENNHPSTGTHREQVRFDVWQSEQPFAGDRHALAVSAWRQCQKDQALKAFRENAR